MTTPLLFNPIAGRGRQGELLRRVARERDLRLVPAHDPAETRALAAALAAEHRRLLVAGGDGTLHHALRGLDGFDTLLGLVPIGTGNDFAAALGVPTDLEAAVDLALTAPGTAVDLGRAGDTRFGGIAGVGIVADVLTYLDTFTRRYRGNWVYPWAVVRTVLRYRPLHVRVDSDGPRYDGPAMLVVAANAPRFGGGMRAAPGASMRDGLLDVVILAGTSRPGLLRLLPRVYRGTHLADPACTQFRTREVLVSSDPPAIVYADGESLPVTVANRTPFRIEPGAIRVAV